MISDRQTWPSLAVRTHIFPWHWRVVPRLYFDDIEGWRYTVLYVGPFEITFSSNWPMFTEREASE